MKNTRRKLFLRTSRSGKPKVWNRIKRRSTPEKAIQAVVTGLVAKWQMEGKLTNRFTMEDTAQINDAAQFAFELGQEEPRDPARR